MPQEKLSFEQLHGALDVNRQAFAQDLHNYLLEMGCKATFEEKKTSLLGSYKHTKLKKVIINLLLKASGLHVRIYGENFGKYADFMNTLPEEMVASIAKAGDCGRLTKGTCSPKCNGYDVTIRGERYQKCRYGGFEFLVTDESGPFIKSFIEREIKERTA